MRFLYTVTVIVILLNLGVSPLGAQEPDERALRLETARFQATAFDFTTINIGEETVTLSDFTGQVVFLNFWSLRCVPCVREMPAMDRLNREMQGKPFKMLVVNQREPLKRVKEYIEKFDYTFEVLLDLEGTITDTYRAINIPVTFIIDKKGFIAWRALGSRDWDSVPSLDFFSRIAAKQ